MNALTFIGSSPWLLFCVGVAFLAALCLAGWLLGNSTEID